MDPIRISVATHRGKYQTTFDFGAGALPPVTSAADAVTLNNKRTDYVDGLYKARKLLGLANPKCTPRQAAAFLKEVHDLGSGLQYKLFGDDLPAVSEMFVKALRPLAANPSTMQARIIVLDTGGLFFPLEILPLLDPTDIEPSDDRAYVALRARSFVGMMAVVQRTLRKEVDQNHVLARTPRLPMKIIYHVDLNGAHDEIAFFRSRQASIALDGPWPAGGLNRRPGLIGALMRGAAEKIGIVSSASRQQREARQREQFSRDFTRFLTNPGQTFAGDPREPPDQVFHVSCHCSAVPGGGDYQLIVKGAGGIESCVTISEIETHISQMQNERWQGSQPFVFLNACSTGVTKSGDYARFETLFAGTRHRGVITTETNIPDGFGSPLAMSFYDSLFNNMTVGQALHRARWDMMGLPTNPLGLLYHLYGSPHLSLAAPVAEQRVARPA